MAANIISLVVVVIVVVEIYKAPLIGLHAQQ